MRIFYLPVIPVIECEIGYCSTFCERFAQRWRIVGGPRNRCRWRLRRTRAAPVHGYRSLTDGAVHFNGTGGLSAAVAWHRPTVKYRNWSLEYIRTRPMQR